MYKQITGVFSVLLLVVVGLGCNNASLSEFQQTQDPYGSDVFDDLPISQARLKQVAYNGPSEAEASEPAIGEFSEDEVQGTQSPAASLPQPVIKQKAPRSNLFKSGIYPEPNFQDPNITEIANYETPHPYNANEDTLEFVIDSPDPRGMAIHFKYFNTEDNYDIVSLFDENDTLVGVYHGRIGNFWSEFVLGSKVTVKLRSDANNENYGFIIDRIATRQGTPPSPEPPIAGEADIVYETQHGTTRGLGKKYREIVTIEQQGATALDVRLEKLHIDELCLLSGGCQVKINIRKSEQGAILGTIKGRTRKNNQWLSDIVKEPAAPSGYAVAGDTIVLEYLIDTWPLGWVFNDYGFRIDKVKVQGATPTRFRNKYPIILAHGIFGWDKVMGFDYFFRVKSYLERHNFEVYSSEVPAVGGLQARAQSLKNKVDEVLAKSTALRGTDPGKVNIIAHSMGGLDARLLIDPETNDHCGEVYPSDPDYAKVRGLNYGAKVASLVTVSTPHEGSPVADLLWESVPGFANILLTSIVNKVIPLYNTTEASSNDSRKALFHLTSDFAACFNANFNKEPAGIFYRSYAGKTNGIWPKPNQDEVDLPLAFTYYYMKNELGLDNDGMVPVDSAIWKPEYYRLYKGSPLHADHFNEIGQIAGLTDHAFNHYEFYLYLGNEIVAQGN